VFIDFPVVCRRIDSARLTGLIHLDHARRPAVDRQSCNRNRRLRRHRSGYRPFARSRRSSRRGHRPQTGSTRGSGFGDPCGDVRAVVEETSAQDGRIDILVNNAGIMKVAPITDNDVDDWTTMVDVNIKGVLHFLSAVMPHMVTQGSGHIVSVGSVAGRRPFPGGSVYAATKFAVRALSWGLHLELGAAHGIRRIRRDRVALGSAGYAGSLERSVERSTHASARGRCTRHRVRCHLTGSRVGERSPHPAYGSANVRNPPQQ